MLTFVVAVAAYLAGFASLPAVFVWGWWVQRHFPAGP